MSSSRKQLNVRLSPETEQLIDDLTPVVTKAIGLEVSQSDLFRLGLLELQKKFMPDRIEPPSKPDPKPKKK